MNHIISFHSFRGGTGKTNIAANVAALMTAKGYRVALVDIDLQSPGQYILFDIPTEEIDNTLNGYLDGQQSISNVTYDITDQLGVKVEGQLYLVSPAVTPAAITKTTYDRFDHHHLISGFDEMIDELNLDLLIIDSHPGLNEDMLLTMAISNAMVITTRADQQDYQGTQMVVDVATKLQIPEVSLVVNQVPAGLDHELLKLEMEDVYKLQVSQIFPYSNDMLNLASSGIFALQYPRHKLTEQLLELVDCLAKPLADKVEYP